MKCGRALFICLAAFAASVGVGVGAPAAAPVTAAGPRPTFQLPFDCGSSWTAETYNTGTNLRTGANLESHQLLRLRASRSEREERARLVRRHGVSARRCQRHHRNRPRFWLENPLPTHDEYRSWQWRFGSAGDRDRPGRQCRAVDRSPFALRPASRRFCCAVVLQRLHVLVGTGKHLRRRKLQAYRRSLLHQQPHQ